MDSNNQSEAYRLVSELQEKGWHSFALRLDTGGEASIRSYDVAARLDHPPGLGVLRALLGTGNGTPTLPTNLKEAVFRPAQFGDVGDSDSGWPEPHLILGPGPSQGSDIDLRMLCRELYSGEQALVAHCGLSTANLDWKVLLLPVPATPASQPRLNLYFVPHDYTKPTVEPDNLLRLRHLQAARRRKKRTQHLTTLDLFRLDRSTLLYDDTSGKPSSEHNVLLTGDRELSSSPFVVYYSHPLHGGGPGLPRPPTTHTVTIKSVMPGTHFVWSTRPYRVEDRAERRRAVAGEEDGEVEEEEGSGGEGQGRGCRSRGRGRGRGRGKSRGRGGEDMAEGQGGRGAARGRGRGRARGRERGGPSGDAGSGSEGSGVSEDEAGGGAAVGRLTLDEDDVLDGFLRDCGCDEAKCGGLRARRAICWLRQRGTRHRFEVRSTGAGQGWGVFALEDLHPGAIVFEYVGVHLARHEAEALEVGYEEKGQRHAGYEECGLFYTLDMELLGLPKPDDDTVVDATRVGNAARFINHHCLPNCRFMFTCRGKVDRKSMIPAVEVTRPIKAGEQLYVCYYGERDQDFKDYVRSLPSGPVACTCGAGDACYRWLFVLPPASKKKARKAEATGVSGDARDRPEGAEEPVAGN